MGLPVALSNGSAGSGGAGGAGGAAEAAGANGCAGAAGRGAGAGAAGGGVGAGMPPVERTTWRAGRGTSGSGALPSSGTATGSAAGASPTATGATGSLGGPPRPGRSAFSGLSALALPLAGFGSSTIGSPRSSRLSASRRTRSADGSSMLDEWLFTPILSSSARSSTTWFSTPSSRASS